MCYGGTEHGDHAVLGETLAVRCRALVCCTAMRSILARSVLVNWRCDASTVIERAHNGLLSTMAWRRAMPTTS
jgi:hypothetical protein